MMWQGQGIGTIDIARSPPRPFTDKEIEQLRTLPTRAVVAIQNARLFNETKEALAAGQRRRPPCSTAMSDSMADPQPVFDRHPVRAADRSCSTRQRRRAVPRRRR